MCSIKSRRLPRSASARLSVEILDRVVVVQGIMEKEFGSLPFLAEFREWLASRHVEWTSIWRVGLVGITSSGKTSLVNALLGREILRTRVLPNSNIPVVVRVGREAKATVVFQDHRRRASEFTDPDLPRQLEGFTNEQMNPGNQKGIAEVWLESPMFLLGNKVRLIDLPGLDANEAHEILTMDVRLKDLDVVLYLTTVEVEADQTHREYLERLKKSGKQVILIQNKIDGIRPHAYGDEDVAQTAQKLRKRLSGIAVRVFGEDSIPPIIQVSAIEGLAKKSSSGLLELQRVLGEVLNSRLSLRLQAGWFRDLLRRIEQVQAIEGDPGMARPACREGASLEQIKESLGNMERKTENLHIAKHELVNEINKFETEILNIRSITEAEHFNKNFPAFWDHEIKSLGDSVEELSSQAEDLCNRLGIDTRMVFQGSARFDAPRSGVVEIRTRKVSVTRRVPKQGVRGKIGRFFGKIFPVDNDLGYEIASDNIDEFDREHFIDKSKRQLSQCKAWISDENGMEPIINRPREWYCILAHEHESRSKAFEQANAAYKEHHDLFVRFTKALEPVRKDIISSLQYLDGSRNEPIQMGHTPIQEDLVSLTVSSGTMAMAMLSQEILTVQHLALRESILLRSGTGETNPPEGLLSQDPADSPAVGTFIHRFWPPDHEPEPPLVATEPSVLPKGAVIYILLSAQSPGWNGVDRLMQTLVHRKHPNPLVLGITLGSLFDHQERFDAEGLVEGLLHLDLKAHKHGLHFSGCLVDHDEPAITVLADALVSRSWDLEKECDRSTIQGWLADLGAGEKTQAFFTAWSHSGRHQ